MEVFVALTTSVSWSEAPQSSTAREDGRTGVFYAGAAKNQDGSTESVLGPHSSCSNRGDRRGEERSLVGRVVSSLRGEAKAERR